MSFRPLDVPAHAHPKVRWLYEEMNRQEIYPGELGLRTGYGEHTISNWRKRSNPSLTTFEDILESLGYSLEIVRKES